MKILSVNKFFYPKGGADIVFFDTARLLEMNGHEVIYFAMADKRNMPSRYDKYFVSNVDYGSRKIKDKIKAALRILYSFEARKKLEELLAKERPDIAHIHSIYHQISPSIIHSLKKYDVPIVMTLHDYKLACAAYVFFADNEICERCKNGRHYRCFLRKCVKGSRLKSLLNTAEMYLHHNMMHIYEMVDIFISPSIFLKNKLEECGFGGRISYLPNFIMVKDYSPTYEWDGRSIVYFGRLSREKGLFHLLEAMKGLPDIVLKIIGEGPLNEALRSEAGAKGLDNVRFLGYRNEADLKNEIRGSMFTVLPSVWYENNPRAVLESFALGKPAVGARIGGIPELIKDGETGLTFEPFNPDDLRSKIRHLADNPGRLVEMGKNARSFVESGFNADKHYAGLMEIYDTAMTGRPKTHEASS